MAAEIKSEDSGKDVKDPEVNKRRPRPRFRRSKKDPESNPPQSSSNPPDSSSKSNPEKVEVKKEKVRKCKYFQVTGTCRFGDKCKFLHVPKTETQEKPKEKKPQDAEEPQIQMPTEEAKIILPAQSSSRRFEPVKPVRLILNSSQKGSPEQKKAKEVEINYFKRRFPETKVETSEDKTVVTFTYTTSDPEWVFDVKTVTFIIELSPDHPISLAKLNIDQGLMPWPLLQLLIKNFNEILQQRFEQDVKNDSFEPIGKWFIRQVDRNLLEFFIAGLKKTRLIQSAEACGIKITVFNKPKEEERKLTTVDEVSKKDERDIQKEIYEAKENLEKIEELQGPSQVEVVQKNSKNIQTFASSKIDICANWQDLEQSIGTITLTHFSGATRCVRCSTQEFFDVDVGKDQVIPCKKCSSKQSIKVISVLGHQNCNIFGECYPVGCKPTDLILQSSKLAITCLNCSKDLIIEALPYGSPNVAWCRQCNTKFRFVIHSFSFRGLTSAIPRGEFVKSAKKKAVKDEFVIHQGQPLPKNGTCKHYGKSFRWFRFPCCGKLYPCDICHSEVEKDHEMKFANRMICGFCSTEQPYSKESCTFCKGSVIKTRSAFWEGGKGCRDQKKMCKNDPRKYKNTDAKTIPKKRTGQVKSKKEN